MTKREKMYGINDDENILEKLLAETMCHKHKDEFEVLQEYNNKIFGSILWLFTANEPLPFVFLDTMTDRDSLKMGGIISLFRALGLVIVNESKHTVELNHDSEIIQALQDVDMFSYLLKTSIDGVNDLSHDDKECDNDTCCSSDSDKKDSDDEVLRLFKKIIEDL